MATSPLSAGSLNLKTAKQTPMLPGLGGTPVKSPVQLNQGSMGSLLSMGTKTKVPGGVNTNVPNKTNQPAPASQQFANGGGQTITNLDGTKTLPSGLTTSASGGAVIPTGGAQGTPLAKPPIATSQQGIQIPGSFGALLGAATGAAQTAASTGQTQQQQAFNKAQEYQQALQQSQEQEAKSLGAVGTSPIPLEFQQGRAGVLQGQYTAQQAALGSALQGEAALANTGATLQGTGITGLGNAASQAKPAGSFPFSYDPLTGQFTSAAGSGTQGSATTGAPTLTYNPQQDASTLASLVIGLKIPYSDAINAMGYAGNIGTGLLQTAIAAQGGNLTKIQAQQGAIQSNIQTTGTAGVQAANTAYNSAVQKVAANTATYSALTGVSKNLNDTLANWSQTGQLTNVNQAINTIAGLTSNPQYQQFITALGNAQASYQAALGSSGVTPTKADQDALAALNPNSSAGAINAALNQLSADAHALLVVPAYQQQQTYAQQLGIQ